jgi:hypothetical protein
LKRSGIEIQIPVASELLAVQSTPPPLVEMGTNVPSTR